MSDTISHVRILFWNVGRAPLAATIAEVAHHENADLVCLAESEEALSTISTALNAGQTQMYVVPIGGLPDHLRRQLRVFVRLPERCALVRYDDHGLTARQIIPPLGLDFTFIGLHLRSKLYTEADDQTIASTRLRRKIEDIEAEVGHRRTVIVGDLNMDPFERGVVAADCLHAVMARNVALKGSRSVDDEDRYFFYNPMWNHFGDRLPSPPGTYFRGPAGQTSYYWHMFDQVLIRPELLPFFDDASLRIVTHVGTRPLLNDEGIPNKASYSDHLPLVFDLSIERGLNDDDKPVGEAQAAG